MLPAACQSCMPSLRLIACHTLTATRNPYRPISWQPLPVGLTHLKPAVGKRVGTRFSSFFSGGDAERIATTVGFPVPHVFAGIASETCGTMSWYGVDIHARTVGTAV